ncbi:MAG: hypothetical protein M1830_005461 [Pleopsidium flavum]|nr:MAG: hypothetical protein M1830_005461 [Pleopsidium flavum]
MGHSLESSRPIMAPSITSKRASARFSTYSGAPSLALSEATVNTTTSLANGDPRMADIKEWELGFNRLESKRLQQQRFVPSAEKSENLSKLALGAKVERALNRRLSGQDAAPKTKVFSEKPAVERGATTA